MSYRSIWIVLFVLLYSTSSLGSSGRYAFISKDANHAYHEGLANGIRKQMSKEGVHLSFFSTSDQKDLKTQEEFIQSVILDKFDGVILCPNDSIKITSSLKLLDQAKIPFVIVDTQVNESRSLKSNCGFVGSNNEEIGREAYRLISKKVKKGTVLIIQGAPNYLSSQDREKGFRDEAEKEKSPIQIKAVNADWQREVAYEILKKTYTHEQLSQIKAIFALNDHMALGAAKLYRDLKIKKPFIVGVDGTVIGQRGLLEGNLNAIIVQATELMGSTAVEKLLHCSRAKLFEYTENYTPTTVMERTSSLDQP